MLWRNLLIIVIAVCLIELSDQWIGIAITNKSLLSDDRGQLFLCCEFFNKLVF